MKPLEEIKTVATSSVQPSQDAETVDEVVRDGVDTNSDVRRTQEAAPLGSRAVLDAESEHEPLPLLETKSLALLTLPPEPSEKKKVEKKKSEEAPRPPLQSDSTRDVEKPVSSQDAEKAKKRQNALTRTIWTFIMIAGFLGAFFPEVYSPHTLSLSE